MAGYQVNFGGMSSAMSHFEEVLGQLQKEMKELENIKAGYFNDNAFKGGNKIRYMKTMEQYQTALTTLYNNAVEHLAKLNEAVQLMAVAENE